MTPKIRIPFNKVVPMGRELEYVTESLRNGHIAGDGPFTKRCESFLEGLLGARRVLLTTSCTHALEMAALLLELEAGEEVIVPSFTFVSTANAFALRGARVRFADIERATLDMDPASVEKLLSKNTKALVPVHYAGVGCDMKALAALAAKRGAAVIEDNAHGLFGRRDGKFLGTFGAMATQSFHETKNIAAGEAGALVLNDEKYVARAEILREKGTNRAQFFRGQVDKYTWVDVGSSYVPSDMLAAFLFGQLEARDRIQAARRAVWERYRDGLKGWAAARGVRLPEIPANVEQPYHMFWMLFPSLEERQEMIAHLKSRGILAVFHYVPLHLSPVGRKMGGKPGDCPVTEEVSDRLLRLPLFAGLGESEQNEVIDAVQDFARARR